MIAWANYVPPPPLRHRHAPPPPSSPSPHVLLVLSRATFAQVRLLPAPASDGPPGPEVSHGHSGGGHKGVPGPRMGGGGEAPAPAAAAAAAHPTPTTLSCALDDEVEHLLHGPGPHHPGQPQGSGGAAVLPPLHPGAEPDPGLELLPRRPSQAAWSAPPSPATHPSRAGTPLDPEGPSVTEVTSLEVGVDLEPRALQFQGPPSSGTGDGEGGPPSGPRSRRSSSSGGGAPVGQGSS
jgi:hypothetical protein